jgi:hypothetical protein
MRTKIIMPAVPIVCGPDESTTDVAGEELEVVVTAGGFDKIRAVHIAVVEAEIVTVIRLAVIVLGPSPNSEFESSEFGSSEFGLSERGLSVVGLLGRDPFVSEIVKRFERDRI